MGSRRPDMRQLSVDSKAADRRGLAQRVAGFSARHGPSWDWRAEALGRAHKPLRHYGEIALFGIGFIALIFLVGMVVGAGGMFPWPLINAAIDSAADLRENAPHYLGI